MIDTKIECVGTPNVDSPIESQLFTDDGERILYNIFAKDIIALVKQGKDIPSFEKAGARQKILYNASKTKAAIVSCGGLCPGINNVIRTLVIQLYYVYGVKNILGFRYGYQGLNPKYGHKPLKLVPNIVKDINKLGGSFLGSSRGKQPINIIVDYLEELKIGCLFTIGGDGTLRGASSIANEVKKRNLNISVIGIPKTIDNDISYVARSFGFETAFSAAAESIASAHAEAIGAPNGIGLVKLMGRHSGFIASNAALALKEVNYVLIPEVDFDIEGNNGLLTTIKKRLDEKDHAVIVVAEGAGQKYVEDRSMGSDPSGNIKLGDIGLYLKKEITNYFKSINYEINLKYIDPSYIIRSVPANPNDSAFCGFLAQNAVHAAMAGKTNMIVGVWNNMFVHLPIPLVTSKRKQVDPKGALWQSILESNGQPSLKN